MKKLLFLTGFCCFYISFIFAQSNPSGGTGSSSGCSASFTNTIGLNDTINFHYTGNSIVSSFFWEFGDGNTSTDQNPSHYFSIISTYSTCLTVTDTAGCVDTHCQHIHFNHSPCQAFFTYSNSSAGPLEFTFYGSGSPMHTTSWQWDFGDGDSSSLQVPSHTFDSAGIYTVCLTTSDGSCFDTYCQYVYTGQSSCFDTAIIDMAAGCNFIYSPVCGCDGITYSNACVATYYNGVISYSTGPCGSGPSTNHASIYGNVQHNNVNADNAKVYLYSIQPGYIFTIDTFITTDGSYVFHNIAQGDYILKAELLSSSSAYNDFAPTYYTSNINWNQADTLTLDTVLHNVNIDLVPVSLLSGPGTIGGNLSWQGGLKLSYGSEESLENIPVFLLDSDGQMLNFTYTVAHGDFSFENIPYGSYQIYVEWLGKESEVVNVVLNSENETVDNIEFFIGESIFAQTTGMRNQTLSKNYIKIYPNPANQFANLLIHDSGTGKYEISILDVFGKKVKQTVVEACLGSSCSIELNVATLSSGFYIVEIRNNGNVQLEKLIIAE